MKTSQETGGGSGERGRPVYEDPAVLWRVIEKAYQAAFRDPAVRDAVQGQTARLTVRFTEWRQGFTVAIRRGICNWRPEAESGADVEVIYGTAEIFHNQFWDSRQFMFDALAGHVEFRGSTQAGRLFGRLAGPFMRTYQSLTRADAPPAACLTPVHPSGRAT